MFDNVRKTLSKWNQKLRDLKWIRNVGIDLGTSSVYVYVQGKGIRFRDPTLVAIDTNTDSVVKVGKEAQKLQSNVPANIALVRPLRDGVITQYVVTLKMIQYFIHHACGNTLFQPQVMICIPSGITEVEEKAVLDAARDAGARKTYLIEAPTAAALGAGLDIFSSVGKMVVDIGSGTTDIAVLSLGGTVVSESVKVAGEKFDDAIARYVLKKYGIRIGLQAAETIKKQIGAASEDVESLSIDVKGTSVETAQPKLVTVTSREIVEALAEPLAAITDTVCNVIARTPPELLGDIVREGIVLTGGGSLLRGLDRVIEGATGVKTRVAEDAISCAALGTGKYLDHLDMLRESTVEMSEERKLRA